MAPSPCDNGGKPRKRTRTVWTEEDAAYLREHWNRPTAEIAAALGKTPHAVNVRRCKLGLCKRPRAGHRTDEYRQLHAEGLSDKVIALRMGLSLRTVARMRKALGLEPLGRMDEATRRLQGERARRTLKRRRKAEARAWRQDFEARRSEDINRVYSDDESEFLKEIAAWRGRHGRAPTLVEGYQIARRLGWAKEGG